MSEARTIINQIVEDELSDLMRMDPHEGFDYLDKEPMIEAEWTRPMNLRSEPTRARLARIVNTVEAFVLKVGEALKDAGYDVTTTSNFDVEDGIEATALDLRVSTGITALAVEWAANWLLKNGHLKSEEIEPLKEMFLA